jgi:drug/metabolite transporter (DMT)-like permease
MPSGAFQWSSLLALAILPTIVSFFCATAAIQYIGSTSTAILGSLEPVTAVILSMLLLHQPMTLREAFGGLLILLATILVLTRSSKA